MEYKLIVSDLDGTLLDKNMKISPENTIAMQKMTEMGINIAISSGRTLSEILDRVDLDDNIRYIAYSNGAAIYDAHKCEKIASFEMNRSEIAAIFELLKDLDAACVAHINGKSYYEESNANSEAFKRHRINGYYQRIILDMNMCESVKALSFASEAVESLVVFFADEDKLRKTREKLASDGRFAVSSSVAGSIEINSARAGKGTALLEIATRLGIDPALVIGVGDNLNDVPMFDAAALSLCVADGEPDACSHADYVICESSYGIMRYIYENRICFG